MTSIKGYENYTISDTGIIINTKTGRELKTYIGGDGYYGFCISKNGKRTTGKVHRLVAEAYIPNPDNKYAVDHINRIRTDNRIENLRWATSLENGQNQGHYKSNTSGIKNVSYDEKRGKWLYQKTINGVRHIKMFDTPEEAIEYKNSYEN